jgi:hypothetical protein
MRRDRMTKEEIRQHSKDNEFIYVVDESNLIIYNYKTADINFNMGRNAILDVKNADEIESFVKLEDAREFLKECMEEHIENKQEELGSIQEEIKQIEEKISNVEVYEAKQYPYKVDYGKWE